MKRLPLLLIAPFILAGCGLGSGVGRTVTFEKPDIKDDFCGVHINFQYCKCAFHDEYCEAVGMNRSAANAHVRAEYDKWVDGLLAGFAEACVAAGGIDRDGKCDYCEESHVVRGDACVPADEASVEESETAAFVPDGPLDNSCAVIPDRFDAEWKRYSDIDDRIPFEERSFEAKGAVTAYDRMIDLMIEGFETERDREIEAQMIAELETYKQALVMNIKTNLLKAFWRLSWVTYQTVKGGKDLGTSYSTLLTEGASVETVGAGLKVVQGLIPGDSALAIDTSTLSGKAKSVGANTALEAIDSLGDPTKIATELFKSAANAPLPSADLTPEEIEILKDQHLTNGVVDAVLMESRAANARRDTRMAEIEAEIAELQAEIALWESQEKERVRLSLEESCRTLKAEHDGR